MLKRLLIKLGLREEPRKTLYHKDFEGKTILAKTINGVHYYRFKDDIDMPYGRYLYLSSFIQAIELRMDLKTLDAYLDKIEANLSGGKGNINIGSSLILLQQLRTRTRIRFDEELAYQLASCIFFTDEEELNTYSMEKNKQKIEAWKRSGTLDFFMLKPVKELLGLGNLSISDLTAYLQKTRPILEELNTAMKQATNNVTMMNPGEE